MVLWPLVPFAPFMPLVPVISTFFGFWRSSGLLLHMKIFMENCVQQR